MFCLFTFGVRSVRSHLKRATVNAATTNRPVDDAVRNFRLFHVTIVLQFNFAVSRQFELKILVNSEQLACTHTQTLITSRCHQPLLVEEDGSNNKRASKKRVESKRKYGRHRKRRA